MIAPEVVKLAKPITLPCGVSDDESRRRFSDWCERMLGAKSMWAEQLPLASRQPPIMLVEGTAFQVDTIRSISESFPFGLPFRVMRLAPADAAA